MKSAAASKKAAIVTVPNRREFKPEETAPRQIGSFEIESRTDVGFLVGALLYSLFAGAASTTSCPTEMTIDEIGEIDGQTQR
ncbi:MAG TPA: hypothetical protein PLD20_01370 [Blastocatellia bacterium]|nr:hypothetical protein [Blastocatellia bacterium]HMV83305.1 hypothetical protein [Blastocatellia bacterium]HMY73963.1 hypothetical protein [Blastocatellia bacterium]HMZ16586.1 hypothetical protein [Blastocatellia bacterium]HNG28221.1 hypothetical protein [Blastocatellia bacterium]